jgi:hypothetical protein
MAAKSPRVRFQEAISKYLPVPCSPRMGSISTSLSKLASPCSPRMGSTSTSLSKPASPRMVSTQVQPSNQVPPSKLSNSQPSSAQSKADLLRDIDAATMQLAHIRSNAAALEAKLNEVQTTGNSAASPVYRSAYPPNWNAPSQQGLTWLRESLIDAMDQAAMLQVGMDQSAAMDQAAAMAEAAISMDQAARGLSPRLPSSPRLAHLALPAPFFALPSPRLTAGAAPHSPRVNVVSHQSPIIPAPPAWDCPLQYSLNMERRPTFY